MNRLHGQLGKRGNDQYLLNNKLNRVGRCKSSALVFRGGGPIWGPGTLIFFGTPGQSQMQRRFGGKKLQ